MPRYAVSECWGHLFTDPDTGKDREYYVRFVADVETQKLLLAQIQWDANGAFELASDDDLKDIEDSVIDANDAIAKADDFDEVELTDDLPDWASSLESAPAP